MSIWGKVNLTNVKGHILAVDGGQITANGEWLGVFCVTQVTLEPSLYYMCSFCLLWTVCLLVKL